MPPRGRVYVDNLPIEVVCGERRAEVRAVAAGPAAFAARAKPFREGIIRIWGQPVLAPRKFAHKPCANLAAAQAAVGGRIYWSRTCSGPILRGTSRSQDLTALASNSRFCTKSAAMSLSSC